LNCQIAALFRYLLAKCHWFAACRGSPVPRAEHAARFDKATSEIEFWFYQSRERDAV
jgi:hypothetical protein